MGLLQKTISHNAKLSLLSCFRIKITKKIKFDHYLINICIWRHDSLEEEDNVVYVTGIEEVELLKNTVRPTLVL